MFDGYRVLDVHSHVSAPMGGMGQISMFMQSMNSALPSPIDTPSAAQFGLDDEAFDRSVAAHMAYIDERSIDAQILGPRPFLMQGFMEDHLLPAWTRVVNDAIAKQCRMRPDRFLGAAQLAQNPQAPDASHMLAELDRCVADYGFVATYVSPDPEGRRNSPGLNDRWWDPLYERCERGGLPIIVHGTNCLDPRIRHVPHNYQLGFVVEQFLATQILSHGDVFDRFPGLKVIICHCGGALDRFIPTDPHLAQKDLSNNLFFDTCAHDVDFLRCAFMQRGVNRMLFGTEAPGSGRAPRPEPPGISGDDLVPVIASLDFLTDADRRAVFHDNAAAIFPQLARL